MKPLRNFCRLAALVVSLATLSPAAGWALPSSETPNIMFRGTSYLWRTTQGNQSTYTPAGQEDESAFADMLSINLYPSAHDQQALATITSRVRTIAENAKASILPASSGATDAHYFAAVIATPHGADFDATRFVLLDKQVVGVFYTHRSYGASAVDVAKAWSTKNAASVEQELLRIDAARLVSPGVGSSPAPVASDGTLPPGTMKAGTLASPLLVRDTMQGVAGKVATLGCDKIEDVTHYVVTPYSGAPKSRQWREKWMVKGCGKQYPVDIDFQEDGKGGADWAIKN